MISSIPQHCVGGVRNSSRLCCPVAVVDMVDMVGMIAAAEAAAAVPAAEIGAVGVAVAVGVETGASFQRSVGFEEVLWGMSVLLSGEELPMLDRP
jgi:hypothetical protein